MVVRSGDWIMKMTEVLKKKNMTIDQGLKHLLDRWKDQDKEFKDKYRSYRSKLLNQSDYVGEGKKREMLLAAGYKIVEKVTPPKKKKREIKSKRG